MPKADTQFPWRNRLSFALAAGLLISAPGVSYAQQYSTVAPAPTSSQASEHVALPTSQSALTIPAIPAATNPAPAPVMPKLTAAPSSASSIAIPAPPPPSTMSVSASDLAAQAEQAALQAQADADAAQTAREQSHNEKSFERAESGILPMSPDQIRSFMRKLEDTQSAAQPPTTGQPHGQVRISTLSLDPGSDPPQINVAAGYVTTINMLDASGEPWPILDVGIGGNFEVSPTQAGAHVVRVTPLTRIGSGNLSILLKDLPTPVIFKLNAGGPNVDLRYDGRIPKYGPNAKMPLVDHPRLEAGNDQIMNILENAPPGEAKRMKVSGLDERTKAWMLNDHVYVRTPLTLLSPSWNSSVTSADGMTVYEIGDAPVLLMSDNGAVLRARLLRDEDHDK